MLKSSFSPDCLQCKDGCQGVAEGVAKVSIPKTRLRQEKDPPAGVATKNSVHIERGKPKSKTTAGRLVPSKQVSVR